MTTRTGTDLSRFTVITPARWAEVCLPSDLPLADLLPALVVHIDDEELDGQQVVLQRLGSPPLDEDRTPVALGLRDGETLYLRAAEDAAPALRFDDLVDGVATGVRRRHGWAPERLRVLLRVLAALASTAALGVLLLLAEPDPAWQGPVGAAAVAVAATVAARQVQRKTQDVGTVRFLVSAFTLPWAAGAGVQLAGAEGSPVAAVAVVLVPTVVVVATMVRRCGVLIAGLLVVVVGALAGRALETWPGLGTAHAAAVVLVAGCLLGQLAPTNAFRLAGIKVPVLPTSAEDLDRDVEPLPGEQLLIRARRADDFLTALLMGLAVVVTSAGVLVSRETGRAATALVLAVAVLHLVRSRSLLGLGQRLAAVTTGVVLVLAELTTHVVAAGAQRQLIVVALLVVGAGALTAGAVVLPGRPLVPHLGRAAEVTEVLAALALVPLVLAVLDVYRAVGEIGG